MNDLNVTWTGRDKKTMAISDQMSAVAEHSLVRVVTPFLVAGILGVCGWLFSSVMSLEQQDKLLKAQEQH